MATFSFLRRPVKLVLYGLLLALLCAAALIFFLQYRLDREALLESREKYAYLGIAYVGSGAEAQLTPLPEDAERVLKTSEAVDSVQVMGTYAGKLLDGRTLPTAMMTSSQLQQRFFIEATVSGAVYPAEDPSAAYYFDNYVLSDLTQWGAQTVGNGTFRLALMRMPDEARWEIGQHVFFTAPVGSALTSASIQTPRVYAALNGAEPTDVFDRNPFVLLGEDEGEAEIWEFMEESGIAPYYNKYAQLAGSVTVRTVTAFDELFNAARGRTYPAYGRALTAEDVGKKVCMINQNLMLRNRYTLGDTITLSIAQDSYRLENGWQSGFPMPDDELIDSYGAAEEYEIVGIYYQVGRDAYDPLCYSDNDIFIPVQESTDTLPLPYAFTFRVEGPEYDAFEAEVVPALEATDCSVRMADGGWDAVADTYYSMELRSTFMFCCAALTFLAAAIVFCLLLHHHLRREYGLQRLLGAYRREALRVYFAAVASLVVPALLVAALAGQWIFKTLIRGGATIGQDISVFLLPAALGALICLLLPLLTAWSERGSLRRVIM